VELLLDILFGRTHENAPRFWCSAFVVGVLLIMFGAFDPFERRTRGLRQMIREQDKPAGILARLRIVPRKWEEQSGEAMIVLLGAIGRKSWRLGVMIAPVGAIIGTWRNTVWPYS